MTTVILNPIARKYSFEEIDAIAHHAGYVVLELLSVAREHSNPTVAQLQHRFITFDVTETLERLRDAGLVSLIPD